MIEAFFNTSHLSDVGCTYRLLRRELAKDVAAQMSVDGNHAGVEIMLLTIVSGARFVEVPVNYLPRVGRSSVTGEPDRGHRRRAAHDPHRARLQAQHAAETGAGARVPRAPDPGGR